MIKKLIAQQWILLMILKKPYQIDKNYHFDKALIVFLSAFFVLIW